MSNVQSEKVKKWTDRLDKNVVILFGSVEGKSYLCSQQLRHQTMLTPHKINAYCVEYKPEWVCEMPAGCPPEDVLVPSKHPFFRLANQANTYTADDFKSYAEADPQRNWGERLPLAVGLSLIDNEVKARKNLKLPMFRQFKGVIALTLYPTDGVVKQTGVHLSHYTWWRTKTFQMSNLTMPQL